MSTPDAGTEHHETQTEVARKDCPVDPDGDLEDPNNLVRANTMSMYISLFVWTRAKQCFVSFSEILSPKLGGFSKWGYFCLRRSPDHGTVDVVVVVVVVLVGGTTLVFDFFQDTEIFIK